MSLPKGYYVGSGILLLALSNFGLPAQAQQYRCSDISLGNDFSESVSYNHQNDYLAQNNVRSNSGSNTAYNQQNNAVAYDRSRTGGFENENSGQFSDARVNQESSSRYRDYDKGGGGSLAGSVSIPTPGGPIGVSSQQSGNGYTKGANDDRSATFNSTNASGAFDRDQRGYGSQNDIYSQGRGSTNYSSGQSSNYADTSFVRDNGFQKGSRNTQSTVVAGLDCRDVNYLQHQDKMQMMNSRNQQMMNHHNSNQIGRQNLNQFMRF